MDVTSQNLIQAATTLTESRTAQAVQVSVLKKALDASEAGAMALLQALPQPTGDLPLASEGHLGTQLNTLA